MLMNWQLADCGIERCTLSVILHEQEIVRCASFYLEASDFEVLVIVLGGSRIAQLDCVVYFTLDLSDCLRFEYGTCFVLRLYLHELATDSLDDCVGCKFAMPFTCIRAWPG